MMASGDVPVRPMGASDVGRVMEIAAGLEDAPKWPRAAYQAAVGSDCRIARVAEFDGSLAGFAIVSLAVPEAELETIAVAERFQRRGVGRRLLDEIVDGARALGVEEMHLEVRASNRAAREFYRVLGFAESGRRVRYYADPVEDAVLMRLRLVS
jgi:[ribosomal protein S18]-alanine N-acetyltransferase